MTTRVQVPFWNSSPPFLFRFGKEPRRFRHSHAPKRSGLLSAYFRVPFGFFTTGYGLHPVRSSRAMPCLLGVGLFRRPWSGSFLPVRVPAAPAQERRVLRGA